MGYPAIIQTKIKGGETNQLFGSGGQTLSLSRKTILLSTFLFQGRPVCPSGEGEHQDEDQAGEAGGEGGLCRHHWYDHLS